MRITLAREEWADGETYWVFRLNGCVIGKCNYDDDPENPVYWFLDDVELQHPQMRRLADAYMFLRRLG